MATKSFLEAMKRYENEGYDNIYKPPKTETPSATTSTIQPQTKTQENGIDNWLANKLSKNPTLIKGLDFLVNNPVTKTISGFGAGANPLTWNKNISDFVYGENISNNIEKVKQESPTAAKLGEMTTTLAPFAKASQLVGKIPQLAKLGELGTLGRIGKTAIQEGLSGLGVGAAEGLYRGEGLEGAKNRAITYGSLGAGIGGLSATLGKAALPVIGGAIGGSLSVSNPNATKEDVLKGIGAGAGLGLLPLLGGRTINTLKLNNALQSTGKSIDNYQFPQLREAQLPPRPELPTINQTIPIKYNPLPKIDTQLALPPANPYMVAPEFKTEIAGDTTRVIRGQSPQATKSILRQQNNQSNIKSLPTENNLNIKPLNESDMQLLEFPNAKNFKPKTNSVKNISDTETIAPSNIVELNNLPIKESAVKTNTMINKIPELQTLEGQKFAKDFEATYSQKPNEVTISRANEMLSKDYAGTYNKIMSNGIKTAEDNMAAWKITRDLLAAKDFNKANELISKVRPIITENAQIVQSMAAIPKDSLEGIVLNARKVIDSIAEKAIKDSPDLVNQIKNESNIVKDVLSKNWKLIDINLQLFAESMDKDLKKALGKLYKKDYINSIVRLAEEGKLSEETLTNAIKQKYGIPTFDGTDLQKIADIYKMAEGLPKNEWSYRAAMDEIDKTIRSKFPRDIADKLSTYQFINMYGNTLTPIKIKFGNLTSTLQNHIKDVLKHAIDVAIPGKTVTNMPSLKTKYQGYKKGVSETWKDYRKEVDTDPFLQSYDFDMKHGLVFQNKIFREAEKLTKFLMSVMERPYKQAIYDDELRMLMKKANVSEPTEEMITKAIDEAQKAMFANRSVASNTAQNFRSGINNFTNKGINKILPEKYRIQDTKRFGIGNLIQPVIKTPINMVARAAEYSPLNLLTMIPKSGRNREQVIDKLAKTIIGSTLGIGAGYTGKKSGIISGGLPTDSDARNFSEESGRQPYSINAFDKSMDISYIQPLGMLISFGAELGSDNQKKQPFVAAIDSLLNNAMLQGFAKMLGSTAISRGSLSENILDAATGGATTMIPFSGLQNQVSKSIDIYKRDTGDDNILKRNLINRTIARTPARLTLPPKITNTGEYVKEDSLFNTWLLPGKIKDVKNDQITNELMRLYNQSNETKQFPPKSSDSINYILTKGGLPQKTILTPQQKNSFKILLGQGNMKSIEKTINSLEYQKANDKEKANILSNAMSQNKQETENNFLKSLGINEYKAPKNRKRR